MKFVLIQADGMPDRPLKELGNRTPLEAAITPFMDSLVQNSIMGTVNHIPEGMDSGSDVGNLSILGYDPKEFFTGRSPLEAESIGISLDPADISYRCNLVKISGKEKDRFMEDHSAGHIESKVSKEIIDFLKPELDNDEFELHHGVSYRHILVWKNGLSKIQTTPPHDILEKNIMQFLPRGEGAEKLQELMSKARQLIMDFKDKTPEYKYLDCSDIWLWGQGVRPQIPSFKSINGIGGSVISAVDLIKGIGKLAGLDVLNVEGATGYLDTNYKGKVDAAIQSLKKYDFTMIHIEAPDETGHEGDYKKKIQAINDLDSKVIGEVVHRLKAEYKEYKVCVVSDHPTPVELRTHSYEFVPFMIYDSRNEKSNHDEVLFNEKSALKSDVRINDGHELLKIFLA